MRRYLKSLLSCFLLLPGMLVPAIVQSQADTGILDGAAVAGAEPGDLREEARLFETMSKGVALSLAECEITDACALPVSRPELERIVETLESRITTLAERHNDTGDPDLEPVLLAYAGVRDQYSAHLEKLGEIAPADEPEDAFTADGAGTESAAMPEQFEVFEDFDEELTDDKSLDEFDSELPADEAEDLE